MRSSFCVNHFLWYNLVTHPQSILDKIMEEWGKHTSSFQFIGRGWGHFLRWWSPSAMCVGVFNLFKYYHWDVWIISSFRNCGHVLHAEHVFHVSSQIVASISESSLLFRPCWRKLWPLSLRSELTGVIPSFILTFFWLVCYFSMWLYLSPASQFKPRSHM